MSRRSTSFRRSGGIAILVVLAALAAERAFPPPLPPADSGLVPMAWTDNVELLDVTRQAAEDAAADQVEAVLGADHGATITVVEGGPAEALLAAARDADLLVVGNRGRGNIAAALLGSTSAKVADEAACPVVVVRAQTEP